MKSFFADVIDLPNHPQRLTMPCPAARAISCELPRLDRSALWEDVWAAVSFERDRCVSRTMFVQC